MENEQDDSVKFMVKEEPVRCKYCGKDIPSFFVDEKGVGNDNGDILLRYSICSFECARTYHLKGKFNRHCWFCGKKRMLQKHHLFRNDKRFKDVWIYLCIECHKKFSKLQHIMDYTKDIDRNKHPFLVNAHNLPEGFSDFIVNDYVFALLVEE